MDSSSWEVQRSSFESRRPFCQMADISILCTSEFCFPPPAHSQKHIQYIQIMCSYRVGGSVYYAECYIYRPCVYVCLRVCVCVCPKLFAFIFRLLLLILLPSYMFTGVTEQSASKCVSVIPPVSKHVRCRRKSFTLWCSCTHSTCGRFPEV